MEKERFFIRHLDFYTDGAWSSATDMGGWGLVVVEDDEVLETQGGYEPYTTNNRMELTAILTALRIIDQIESSRVEICIITDSAYCCNALNEKWYVNWLNNGWKTSDKRDVKNQDLWRRIVALYIKLKDKHSLKIIKVKSHNNNK